MILRARLGEKSIAVQSFVGLTNWFVLQPFRANMFDSPNKCQPRNSTFHSRFVHFSHPFVKLQLEMSIC